MYTQFFGLSSEPFSLTPDPSFLYRSPGHSEALAALTIGLQGRRGLMVMTGEVGTGKTTLLYSLLGELGPEIRTAYLSNTKLSFDDMLCMALADLGVACTSRDRVEMLTALNDVLRSCAEKQETAALIIDEAQDLDEEAFEHLRLLSNFETFRAKLLQIVLVGQPELEAKLRQPSLRQVAGRVAVHCRIDPLSRRESRAYIDYRLRCAGASPDLFTPAARRLVARTAHGIPRRINILCHNALLFAYGRGARHVSRSLVRAAGRQHRQLASATAHRAPSTHTHRRAAWFSLPVFAAASASLAVAAGVVGALRLSDHLVGERTSPPPSAPTADAPAARLANPSAEHGVGIAADRQALDSPARRVAVGAPRTGDAVVVSLGREPLGSPPGLDTVDSGSSVSVPPPVAALSRVPPLGEEPATVKRGAEPDVKAAEPDVKEEAATATTEHPTEPTSFRVVRVLPGATLSSLVRKFYGTVDAGLLDRVRSANPHVADPNHILAGDALRFPELDSGQWRRERNPQ